MILIEINLKAEYNIYLKLRSREVISRFLVFKGMYIFRRVFLILRCRGKLRLVLWCD